MSRKSPNTGFVLWFTGFSGSGKSTTAEALLKMLEKEGYIDFEHLDGDNVREHLCKDLGFSREDRATNLERVTFVAKLLARNDIGVISTFISPYATDRDMVRNNVVHYIEVFVDTPLEVCEHRDVKGLYQKARAGIIQNFTGISDPYEAPQDPEIHITTDVSVEQNCTKIINHLKKIGFLS